MCLMKLELNEHVFWIDFMILHKTLSAVRIYIEPHYNKYIEYTFRNARISIGHKHTLQLNGRQMFSSRIVRFCFIWEKVVCCCDVAVRYLLSTMPWNDDDQQTNKKIQQKRKQFLCWWVRTRARFVCVSVRVMLLRLRCLKCGHWPLAIWSIVLYKIYRFKLFVSIVKW